MVKTIIPSKAPGKTLPLDELKRIYLAIVEEHGEEAYSSTWMEKNGYRGLLRQVYEKHKMKWDDFRKQCGIKFNNRFKSRNETLEELIGIYKSIVLKNGEKTYSCKWVIENGHKWIYRQVTKKHKISWPKFRKKCGIDATLNREDVLSLNDLVEEYKSITKEHGEKAYSSDWIQKNGYSWLYDQVSNKHKLSWDDFRKKSGIDVIFNRKDVLLEDLIEKYKSIIREHGEKAYSCEWLRKNGYLWLYEQINKKYGMEWNDFRKQCGIDVIFKRKNLSLNDLMEEYESIIKESGEKAYSCGWMDKNSHNWLCTQVRKHDIPWPHFVQMSKPKIEIEFSW